MLTRDKAALLERRNSMRGAAHLMNSTKDTPPFWRKVTKAENQGPVSDQRFKWLCTVSCGHTLIRKKAQAPSRLFCQACEGNYQP